MARTPTGKVPTVRSTTGRQRTIPREGGQVSIKRTVLVIDDAPEIARLVTKLLGKSYRILVAEDGEEGCQLVRAELPDVVLLDLNLPRLDGWEVCRRIKCDPKTRGIPVVMMTADPSTQDDAQRALGLGADEYLTKPFVREVLIHNIERLLAGR